MPEIDKVYVHVCPWAVNFGWRSLTPAPQSQGEAQAHQGPQKWEGWEGGETAAFTLNFLWNHKKAYLKTADVWIMFLIFLSNFELWPQGGNTD